MAGAGIPALTTTQAAASTQSAAATAREAASTTPTQVDGTDISNQTTVTSWPDIAADNAFVGIMAEQGTGKFIVNTNYASEVNSATSDGMFVMPYIFADPNPNKVATGTDQFNIGWSTISTAPYASGGQDLPVALDMESDPVNFPGEPCYGLTPSAMVTWIQQFVTAAQQKTGLLPIIYTSQSWWNLCTNGSTAFSSDPLWVASYGTSTPAMPTGWSDYAMWQTSGSATVNGVSGPGDTDLLHEPGTIDAAVGGTGSAQVRTLNELAGQTVTYAASGLPTGTSMDSSGLFSWTSATPAGTYQITVTPTVSGGAAPVPSSISFTLNVHGTMTISSVGNHTSVAGDSVYLKAAASDSDTGYSPTFSASGLPAGVSINSSTGQITGFPYAPGTYTVKVSAADALGAAASTSFTWTINAASSTGATGTVRQVGGTGKCLTDPNGSAANGTQPYMSTCNGASYQNWTTVQDGTLRIAGKCLGVAGNGTTLELWTCNSGSGTEEWQAGSDSEIVNPATGKCVYIPVTSASNGTKPVLSSCANDAQHRFLRAALLVAAGSPAGKCLAVSGTTVVLVSCTGNSQLWVDQASGFVTLAGKCLAEGGTSAGSPLTLGTCSNTLSAQRWTIVSAGRIATEIKSAESGLCVSSPSSGTSLVIESCTEAPAETWRIG